MKTKTSIYLTTSISCDRTGIVYGGKIEPDIVIGDDDKTPNDETLDAAVKWLEEDR